MSRDHIAEVFRAGLPVQGARWLRDYLRSGDPVARSVMYEFTRNPNSLPAIPEETEEARWLMDFSGVRLPNFKPRPGAYALGTVSAPVPGGRLGCVRWVSFEEGGMSPEEPLFKAADAAYLLLLNHGGMTRKRSTCGVTLRRADRPEDPGDPVARRLDRAGAQEVEDDDRHRDDREDGQREAGAAWSARQHQASILLAMGAEVSSEAVG